MSDRLSLSCWLRGFHLLNMQSHWEKLLRVFPQSRLAQGSATFRVLAVNLSEPVQFEQSLALPYDVGAILAAARDFQAEDCAFQLECPWDLMQLDGDWALRPATAILWCFAPAFENDTGDHLRIDFGLEALFLPQANDSAAIRSAQANLRSVMQLVQQIGAALPLERRYLWSESGVNFAEKLERSLRAASVSLVQ